MYQSRRSANRPRKPKFYHQREYSREISSTRTDDFKLTGNHLVRDEGVAGSNPATPTSFSNYTTKTCCFRQFALNRKGDSYGDRLRADIGNFMGLRVPSSTWIYPRIFVNNLRKINTGHPEAADQLVSDNVKEMSSPTRDGRAMIAAGLIHPGTQSTGPVSPVPNVTIGAVHVTNRPASSAGSSQNSFGE